MSKLSEIEARSPINRNTGWDAKDSLLAFEDRRYLLGLVKEMRQQLSALVNTPVPSGPRMQLYRDGLETCFGVIRALLDRLEE